jgi:hypothetical protein
VGRDVGVGSRPVGSCVGAAEGIAVGTSVGAFGGIAVGISVRDVVGSSVGAAVGDTVGLAVVFDVGLGVASAVVPVTVVDGRDDVENVKLVVVVIVGFKLVVKLNVVELFETPSWNATHLL